MSLLESLTLDSQEARKTKDKEKLSVLQMALSAIKNEQIKKQKELTDEDIVAVIGSQVKQLKDACKDFETGGRQDLVDKTKAEIEIFNSYLPEQLDEAEVEKIVKQVIEKISPSGPQDFGRVMGESMNQLKGRADGNVVQNIVKKLLQ
ncbi:GatB/YqeY domain-containing protein [Candidatus Parcubacteria bacterium]|jgi:uncharacterized protein|nr:GatB/YqeY domain-containing protein [Candidatus Parcubacteria bacterium]MBT3948666.1 GatB/YqeY domain-containing protein [Candidatus Parcubacteria bacterium]